MNLNYKRSRSRETSLKHKLSNEGYYVIRAAGSKGIADLVAIRPTAGSCADPSHFEVRFIQIKVSENLVKKNETMFVADSTCGSINVELLKFPVKSKKYHDHNRQNKKKKGKLGRLKPKIKSL